MSIKKIILRSLLALVAVVVLAIAYFIIFVYFKPHVDYLKAEPEIEISGEQLFNAFATDNIGALRKYNGKVLLVNGVVDTLEYPADDLQIAVMIFREDEFWGNEGIRFSLLKGQAERVVVGREISLKGLCTGYTGSDVIIEHASVVSEQHEEYSNEPQAKLQRINGKIVVDGKRLYADFTNDHLAAINTYKDKKLIVSGVINDLERVENAMTALMVFANGSFGPEGVRFLLQPNQANRVGIGNELWLEGICVGYTGFDVVLEQASVSENPGL